MISSLPRSSTPYFGSAIEGQWFEIHNTTSTIFDIEGLVVTNGEGDSFTVEESCPSSRRL